MFKILLLFLFLTIPVTASADFVNIDGTPDAATASGNACFDATTSTHPIYFPGSLSLGGTVSNLGNPSQTSLVMKGSGDVNILAETPYEASAGTEINVTAGAAPAGSSNTLGGSILIRSGSATGSGYSFVVTGAASGGASPTTSYDAQYFTITTGRPDASANPGWLSGSFVGGNFNLQSEYSLSLSAGQNNNVDLLVSGGVDSTVYTVDSVSGDFSVTGLCLGSNAPQILGGVVILRNRTAYSMTLVDDSGDSTSGCRIITSKDADRSTIGTGTAILRYGSNQRWEVISFDE